MAMQGVTAIHEKVGRMLSRQSGKPVLKPNKRLTLKDEVANRKMKKGEATCVTEMSLLMVCWKQNDFNNALCSTEVNTFYKCVERAQMEMRAKAAQQAVGQGGRLLPKQATTLLKRHPNLSKEV